ncbi:hypothetical protein DUNSADRAFT_2477 [Dunaliella salina]|uniref:Uncharacterized protein n=1 Tax=Dunaliella salina TaxID=3046 RepID=A0ABQ7GVK6_DUNSA|nr:hypothetical protein DUNSADRAFT_2477 [Dunaliella salina]|eukprot:KAF5838642.1 hypothetical protein DUNSADRAFT_2477 [Dunaliella salina]
MHSTQSVQAFSELTLLRIVWHLPEGVQQKLGQWYRPVSLARHVHLTSHLPLNDLLGHPNVRAFMCDGSLSSMYHALWHGVPMLTVALTVEQESNVVRALRLGVGRRLQRSHLEQGFGFMVEHTLGRLCASTAYRIRAAELSRRMQAANPTPAKSAAEAIEGALEAGTSTFLHSMEVFLPWWKVMMLDVLAAFLAIILGTVASIWAATMLISKAAAWAQGNGGREAQSPAEEMKKFR